MSNCVEHFSIHDQDSILVPFIKPVKALPWVAIWNTLVFMIKIVFLKCS